MIAAALVLALSMPQSASPSQPPRDRVVTPGIVLDSTAREAELAKRIEASPNGITAYRELAELQERRGAVAEAEATLLRARQAAPKNAAVLRTIAGFYNRHGEFEKAVGALEASEQLDPTDPSVPQTVAVFYWEKAFKDKSLLPAEQLQYVMSGIAATDRALALKPDFMDAVIYKSILLRMRANLETDPVQKQQLTQEADALRARGTELNKQRTAIAADGAAVGLPAPPPPPPPPLSSAPVRVGGNVGPPTKVKDVRPVYPPDAMASKIQGVVILEATIDTDGRVYDARVLRSVPSLDQAAVDAVRQWEFTPTQLNGVPVPVIMTVTVNFTLQ